MITDILLNAFWMITLVLIGLDIWVYKKTKLGMKIYAGFLLFMAGVSLAMYCARVDQMIETWL